MSARVERHPYLVRLFHWVTLLLMVGTSVLGFYFADLQRGEEKLSLLQLHASFGVTVLLLTLLRISAKLTGARPQPLEGTVWMMRAASLAHMLLYAGILVLTIAGVLTVLTVGVRISFFDLFTIPSPFEADRELHHFFEEIHIFVWWVMAVLVGIHVLAALYHHFGIKDGIFSRMNLRR